MRPGKDWRSSRDPLKAVRGFAFGVLLGVLFWVAIIWYLLSLFRK